MPLTEDQRKRYERNLLIPGFGEDAQERLAEARVAIVGLGGLGSPVALYLAAAGVGMLGLVDPDTVELSNLQRQVIHSTPRLGRGKSGSAAETVLTLNPNVRTAAIGLRMTPSNAESMLREYDVVVEATDNFAAKFVLNDACLALKKPFATAGILAMSGQALFVAPGQTPCLRCLTPEPPEDVPSTSEQGVLGAVPGVLGSVQALEVIRWLTGRWTPPEHGEGALHTVDGDAMRLRTMRVPRRLVCRCAPLWES